MFQSNLTLLNFPTTVALGVFHAIEPGHAKTLTAAYLIGIKGTKRDAVLLGLSVAARANRSRQPSSRDSHSGATAQPGRCVHEQDRPGRATRVHRDNGNNEDTEAIAFAMHEPENHHEHGHGHVDIDEEEHVRSHAATMPQYVQQGLRPTPGQIMAFGAASGIIPCPASITVMLMKMFDTPLRTYS